MATEVSNHYKTVRGINKNRFSLYNMDCLDGMRALRDKSVDIVVTSPPYNRCINYGQYRDNLSRSEYLSWMEEVGIQIKRVLRNDGSLFLNIGDKPKDQWISSDVASIFRSQFVLQNKIIWLKSLSVDKNDVPKNTSIISNFSIGHYKPVNSPFYLNNYYEFIYHFTKEGDIRLNKLSMGHSYQDKSNIKRWKSVMGDTKPVGNAEYIPYDTIQSRNDRPHPATFPVKLPEFCISLHGSANGTIVMDPFCGMGSTALAAMKLGTSFIGYDLNREYLREAVKKLRKFRSLLDHSRPDSYKFFYDLDMGEIELVQKL